MAIIIFNALVMHCMCEKLCQSLFYYSIVTLSMYSIVTCVKVMTLSDCVMPISIHSIQYVNEAKTVCEMTPSASNQLVTGYVASLIASW